MGATRKRPSTASGRTRGDRDLRAAVLAASADLLEAEGLAALSMREVARRAGVTHQAPYRHFADKESILAALVEQGFDELTSRLRAALDGVRGKRDSIVASGLAYIRFALARPGVFRVMFQPDFVDLSRFPAAEEAGARAFAELSRLVTRLSLPGPAEVQASLHWSMVHGLAGLLIDGALGRKLGPRPTQEAHARQVLERFAADVLRSVAPAR